MDAAFRRRQHFAVIEQVTEGMDEESDEVLVARTAKGDGDAFRVLMERHVRRGLRLAMRIMGNASDADEIVQDAFLRLWTKAETWQPGRGKFTTWFFRILVNLCLDRRRRASPLPLESAGDPADPRPSALAKIYDDEVGLAVRRAIGELPERQRAALVLCYYEEMSNLEAAEALSISVSALEALLVRARRTLKTKLASLGALGPKEEE
ncbi:MAG TPA: RNA polymerase sigma factor [Alphaproteobacteria bacterium]